MIGFVRGRVAQISNDHCIIDVKGIGYRIFITASARQKLAIAEDVHLYTYLNVREDALSLFGFLTHDEYQLFLSLISVTGIGPKVALGILSSVTPAQFCLAIASKNLTLLTKMPGVGKKTAERLILELKDKLGNIECESDNEPTTVVEEPNPCDQVIDEAREVLLALGYSPSEINPVLSKVYRASQATEETVRLALKEVGRR
ncbi:MAG: Holliday junction branch migration protein RuvA [Veillonellaceae bacterium]|jgi:Holliday junction DNA helicase RuvA|nr:Holliday junction branch migration protein RuvA [Veillonellaceae bacterium]